MARLAAIVLAAGRSSRMGELKPLLPLGDGTAIGRAVGSFLEAGVADVRVVVGWRGDEVAAAVADRGVAVVVNHGWRRGMFSSVATGVAGLDAGAEACFLLPADCALVRAETIGRLARAALSHPAAPVVYPRCDGRRGHPPLIARRALPADPNVEPPDGLRGLLAVHEAEALDVEAGDPGVLLDMDRPSDYRRAREYVEGEAVPDAARCLAILAEAGTPGTVVAHSRAVARVVVALCAALNERGLHLNVPLAEAAGLLHDVARAAPDHARAGAELLLGLGYGRVAAVTVLHMDLEANTKARLETEEEHEGSAVLPGEAEVVFLADKLVAETGVVAIEDRLSRRLETLRANPEGAVRAQARLGRALELAAQVERLIGKPATTVAGQALSASPHGARVGS